MKDYRTYEVEDFLVDDLFIAWVLDEEMADDTFWTVWIQNNPQRRQIIHQAAAIVKGLRIEDHHPMTDREQEEVVSKIEQFTSLDVAGASDPIPFKHRSMIWYSIAATLLISLTAGILFFGKQGHLASRTNAALAVVVIQTQNKTRKPILVHLADGTSVTLQPGSLLKYPTTFSSKLREVYLLGEAFFEVRHDSSHPFLVHSGKIITQVLGTSFTVKAADRNFKVTVNTGKVTVYQTRDGSYQTQTPYSAVTILPNQVVTFNSKASVFRKVQLVKPLPLSSEVSEHVFNFHNTPLSEVIDKLKEAYGVDIEFDKQSIGQCPISASLSTQPLYEKLSLLCEAINAHFTVNASNIRIEGGGCKATIN